MARHPESTESAIRSMVRQMTTAGCYADITVKAYRYGARRVMDLIHQHIDPDAIPARLTPEQITRFDSFLKQQYAPATQNYYTVILRTLCEYSGNYSFRKLKLVHQTDTRPTVRWLTLPDATRLLESPMEPIDEAIIWLGLCHGLRRVEVTRLTMSDVDIERGIITVIGKGRGGGKLRTISIHPGFPRIYLKWVSEREKLTYGASNDCDRFLIYRRGDQVSGFKTSGINWRIWKLSDKLGMDFSMHTLRRTFGRELWHCGVSIATIATIMGHSSTEMTIRYLGINLDDMAEAMTRLNLGKR